MAKMLIFFNGHLCHHHQHYLVVRLTFLHFLILSAKCELRIAMIYDVASTTKCARDQNRRCNCKVTGILAPVPSSHRTLRDAV